MTLSLRTVGRNPEVPDPVPAPILGGCRSSVEDCCSGSRRTSCGALFPLYWPLLEPAGAIEILAHRILWSMVTMGLLVVLLRRTPQVRGAPGATGARSCSWPPPPSSHRQLGDLHLGVNNDRVVETSLGYFINPLVTVLMGVFILGERLRPLQWVAWAIAPLAVVVLTVDYGRLPWVALVLAFSFGTYGLAKKTANVGAVESLALETDVVAPFAAGLHRLAGRHGASNFGTDGSAHALLLALGRHRHRRPADLLRCRRDPGPDGHPRPAAVPRAGPPVRASASSCSTRTCPPSAGSASCWSGSRW